MHNHFFLLLLACLLFHRRVTLSKIGTEFLVSISRGSLLVYSLFCMCTFNLYLFGASAIPRFYFYMVNYVFVYPFIYHKQPQSIILFYFILFHINCRLEIRRNRDSLATSSAPVVSGGWNAFVMTPQFSSRIRLRRKSTCSYLLTSPCI